MPIKSYLAHPYPDKKEDLIEALSQLDECEVIPSKNEEVLILITETDNKSEEDHLKEKLEAIPHIKLLTLVSGFETSKKII